MDQPFLTGLTLGAFLAAALCIWWYHFAGAVYVSAWRQRAWQEVSSWPARLLEKIKGWFV
jgi:hypothetical protein